MIEGGGFTRAPRAPTIPSEPSRDGPNVRQAMARGGSPALWLLPLWMALLLWVYWSSLSCAIGAALPPVVTYAITTERQRWGALRQTPCDGIELPATASIGAFEGRTVPLLRTLAHRDEIATLANQRATTISNLGATELLRRWLWP